MKKTEKCVYCGREKEVTDDHVISRCLFPDSHPPKNSIIVPCCCDCNKGFSKDEEFLRMHLMPITAENSFKAQELFHTKVKRSILRKPKLAQSMLKKVIKVNLYSRGGIFLGNKPAIGISDDDWKRFVNVLDKYVKGLFFHEFKTIMPANYRIHHTWIYEKTPQEIMNNFDAIGKSIKKWNTDNEKIFVYGYNHFPDTYNSTWIMVFFEKQYVLSIVYDEQTYPQ